MIKRLYHSIKKNIHKTARKLKKTIPFDNPVFYSNLLAGRTAYITGATSGIGKSIGIAFLHSGAKVIFTGRNKEKLAMLEKELLSLEDGRYKDLFETKTIDISDTKNLDYQWKESALNSRFDDIDILVNNAGVLCGDNFGNTKIEDFEKVLKTNLEGTYFLSQLFARYLVGKKKSGNILNILSSSANRPAVSVYACSKWAAKGLTMGMAKSLIHYGIVVNALAPGPTATPMLMKDGYEGIERVQSPAGRYATAEEIADMAVILVSSLGKMIVGDTLMMTGGAGVITFDDVPYSFNL